MRKHTIYIALAVSLFFVISCKKNEYAPTSNNNNLKSVEDKLIVVEKNQKEIVERLKALECKGRCYSRFIKKVSKDKKNTDKKIGKIIKEEQKLDENEKAFVKAVNKLIDVNVRQNKQIVKLKRKIYRMWRKTMGDAPTVSKKRKSDKKDTTIKKEDTRSQKMKNRLRKMYEGRG
ncbi:MAG: hypothetical protein P9M13_01355 [Candidatus Ancaeobacter aquaticus]|nr:hypothetical protein [Candidatus Ancaeobacter aquaticus]